LQKRHVSSCFVDESLNLHTLSNEIVCAEFAGGVSP
jgi:hypothetical protein